MSVARASEVLDWRRLGLLLRNDLIGGYRGFLLRAAAVAGVIVVIEIVAALVSNAPKEQAQFWWFYVFLFGWGIVMASGALTELHDRTRNEAYLLLPASALEKVLVRFVLVTLGFYVFFIVFSTVLALVTQTVDVLVLGRQMRWFPRPGEGLQWVFFGNFVVAQSVFFLGAAWFRKAHIFKTALAVAVIYFGLLAFAYIVAYLLVPQFRDGWGLSFREYELAAVYDAYPTLIDGAVRVLEVAYFAGLPALSCFVAWLRVRETQVSHGV